MWESLFAGTFGGGHLVPPDLIRIKHRDHKWKSLYKARHPNGDQVQVSLEDEHWLINKTRHKFQGWVVATTGTIVRKARKQLFYDTFIARYHGLSRDGSDTLSKFGVTMKKSSYDTRRMEVLEQARNETKQVCRQLFSMQLLCT